MKRVVFGYYGATLDAIGRGEKRWQKWRPSVSLCQHDDFLVDRFELLHDRRNTRAATALAEDVLQVSPETDVRLRVLDFRDPWDFEEVFAGLHQLARGYAFDQEREEYLVHITTGTHVMQICWFLLTESRHFPAKLIQTSPLRREPREGGDVAGTYRVIDLDLSRYDSLAKRFGEEREESLDFLKSGIKTRNAAFNQLIEGIERVALRSREPILLTGPTGAGKSQLAARIYQLRKSRGFIKGPLVEVNCATLRGDGAMSALFGHVKGAFTGAASDRKGLLRAADGGTLFLDEIGELGLDEQAMLLRAIEEKRFLPVGTDKEVRSDFELIAGTNQDLAEAVAAGRFREDLLARIQLWSFELPGLAARREDIEPNLDYELSRASERLGTHVTLNSEARARFLEFAVSPSASWRGNFRDLNAAVLRMSTLAAAGRIDVAHVHDETERLARSWRRPRAPGDDPLALLGEVLTQAQRADLDPFDAVQLAEVVRV
ncbi:MAG: RNA repair transcriptional activator RtcR, partial [Myxococcales bacterium]|nr:RNA repair transcriptional activator RtcR [Myxococcales bacterium]